MTFEKTIFSYHAEHFKGSVKELTEKLEQINAAKELSLGFITSPVVAENSNPVIVECVIQTKQVIRGFRR